MKRTTDRNSAAIPSDPDARDGAASPTERTAEYREAAAPSVRSTEGGGWRVATPSFPDCGRMDAFYAEAHRLIEAQFTAECERTRRGTFAADFTVQTDGGDIVIALRLRRREFGRVVAKKVVVHRWRDGYIAPRTRRRPLGNIKP